MRSTPTRFCSVSVGGPAYDDLPFEKKPERGLLRLRKEMDLFANLRPAMVFDAMADSSSLKRDLVAGLDILILRELTGGIYFAEPRGIEDLGDGTKKGFDTNLYTTPEIERIGRVAMDLARKRRGKVTSVEKANVMMSGVLWRETMTKLFAEEGDGLETEHMYADNCGMQLVRYPKQFDVIVTDNLFGDMLSDCAAMLTGSLGMLPSASLGAVDETTGKRHALVRTGARLGPGHRRQENGQPDRRVAQLLDVTALFLRHGRGRGLDRCRDRERAGLGLAHRGHHAGRHDRGLDRPHDGQHPC